MATPISTPKEIKLHTESKEMELVFDGEHYRLSYELLRVLSPSAEVQGHGKPILQTGKRFVAIRNLEPVGNYALKITFDDGHDSGLFTWEYLHDLAHNQAAYWQQYLNALEAAGASRDNGLIARG